MQNNGYDFGAFNDFTDEVLQDLIEKLLEHVNNTSNPHHVTPADLGLGAIDNTSDLDKPISNATNEAIQNVETELNEAKQNINEQISNLYNILDPKVLRELDYIARTIALMEAELARRSLSKCIGLVNTIDDINNIYTGDEIKKGQYYWVNRDIYIDFTEENEGEDLSLYLKKGNRLVAKQNNVGKDTLIELAKALKESLGTSSENEYWALVTSDEYGQYLIDLEDVIQNGRIDKLDEKITKEILRAVTVEGNLNTNIEANTAEITRVNESLTNLINNMNQTLTNSINAVINDLNTEATTRDQMDTNLINRINEVDDNALKESDKNELITRISNEASTRETKDDELTDLINLIRADYLKQTDKTSLINLIDTEEQRRQVADGNLQTQITAIVNDYLKRSDKNDLTTLITQETQARTNADRSLQNRIKVVEDDYLKQADKTEVLDTLDDSITEVINNNITYINNKLTDYNTNTIIPTYLRKDYYETDVIEKIQTKIVDNTNSGVIYNKINSMITDSANNPGGAVYDSIISEIASACGTGKIINNTIDTKVTASSDTINARITTVNSELSSAISNLEANLTTQINNKQDTIVAGQGIQIEQDGKTVKVTIPLPDFPTYVSDTSYTLKLIPHPNDQEYILTWIQDNAE